jgi:hypothetical protein
MLKTCSNHKLLWSKERGGVDVCLDEISLKNSHKSLKNAQIPLSQIPTKATNAMEGWERRGTMEEVNK